MLSQPIGRERGEQPIDADAGGSSTRIVKRDIAVG